MIPHNAVLDTAYGSTAWTPFTRVTLISPTTTGGETQVVPDTVEGTLTHSDTAWPRTTLEMSVPAPVVASSTSLPVSAYGGRARVEMGAVVNGTRYTFKVHELDVSEVMLERPTGAFTVRAVSPEARVNEAREFFKKDPPGLQTSVAVLGKVTEVLGYDSTGQYPVVKTLTNDAGFNVGDFQFDGDIWPTIEAIMDAAGAEAYFRYDRKLVLRDVPVIGSPVMSLKCGTGGTIVAYRDIQRWAFNAVGVRFTSTAGNTDTGIWTNSAGGSATRVTGPYGFHTRLMNRPVTTLPSAARMNAFAASVAKRSAAPFKRLELDCVPAPWLEPGDTVSVTLQEGTARNMLVSGVRIPLSQLDPMTLTMHDSGL